MKIITNIKTDILAEEGKPATVTDLGLTCVRYVPTVNGGIDTEQVRKRSRIIKALEAGRDKEIIKMEDADYDLFVSCIKSMKWFYVHDGIIAFEDAVLDAKTEEA